MQQPPLRPLFAVLAAALGSSCSNSNGPTDASIVEQIKTYYSEAGKQRIPLISSTYNDFLVVVDVTPIDRKINQGTAVVIAKLTVECKLSWKLENNLGAHTETYAYVGKTDCVKGETRTTERSFSFSKYESGWRLDK